jgi:predicted nucleic acid-binding protein
LDEAVDGRSSKWHVATYTAALRRKGKPIPQHDIWIAATAVRHGSKLIALDQHFTAVDGLPTEIY